MHSARRIHTARPFADRPVLIAGVFQCSNSSGALRLGHHPSEILHMSRSRLRVCRLRRPAQLGLLLAIVLLRSTIAMAAGTLSNTLSVNPPLPVSGNILTVICAAKSTVSTAPLGWTQGDAHSVGSWNFFLYTRLATASETIPYQWVFAVPTPFACFYFEAHGVTGVDNFSINPRDSSAALTALSISPVSNSDLLLYLLLCGGLTSFSYTPPADMTYAQFQGATFAAADGTGISMLLGLQTLGSTSAGHATGDFTVTESAATDGYAAQVALSGTSPTIVHSQLVGD